jgi:hypothetical protein
MMRTAPFRKIFPSGTTLLEGIIAIGVIIAAVVGSLVLILSTIKLGRANQDRVVAQNLAREGVELAYTLRNSASYMRVNDPMIGWDAFLQLAVQRDYAALMKYDIGIDYLRFGDTYKDVQWCYVRGADIQTPPNCTVDSGPPVNYCYQYDFDGFVGSQLGGPPAGQASPPDTGGYINFCDVSVLTKYLFDGWPLPPLCNIEGVGKNSTLPGTGVACDYNDDGMVDVSDAVKMVNEIYNKSYHFTSGYPTIATSVGLNESPTARLDFFVGTDTDLGTGTYTASSAWVSTKSRIDLSNHTYTQNVTLTGSTPTKFYRVVSNQEVCRLTTDNKTEYIVPFDNAFNCDDYTNKYFAASSKKVGVLVTSVVRWPTPTSSTKAVYRELLYDWITF